MPNVKHFSSVPPLLVMIKQTFLSNDHLDPPDASIDFISQSLAANDLLGISRSLELDDSNPDLTVFPELFLDLQAFLNGSSSSVATLTPDDASTLEKIQLCGKSGWVVFMDMDPVWISPWVCCSCRWNKNRKKFIRPCILPCYSCFPMRTEIFLACPHDVVPVSVLRQEVPDTTRDDRFPISGSGDPAKTTMPHHPIKH